MQISHGSILAIAEICIALYETGDSDIIQLYQEQICALTSIVTNLPPRSLTTFGSEHIREATCHLITNLSKTHLQVGRAMDDWKNVVHSSLERKEESVQEFAVVAFGAIAESYGFDQEEIDLVLGKVDIQNSNYYGRRGYALALGTLDFSNHHDWLKLAIHQLCKASQVQENPVQNDAESKRNAVLGLHDIFRRIGDQLKSCNYKLL